MQIEIEPFIWRHGGHISVPNNENGAMLVVLKNPLWVEQFFHVKAFFCSNKVA